MLTASNGRDDLLEAHRHYCDLALMDPRPGTESGMEWSTALRAGHPWRSCRYASNSEFNSTFQNEMMERLIPFILKSLMLVCTFFFHATVLFSKS
jgi:hypothetical protein